MMFDEPRIREASRILSELTRFEVKPDVLTAKAVKNIKKNCSSDLLAAYYDDVTTLVEVLKNHFNGKKPQFSENKIIVVYALLKFFKSPVDWLDIGNHGGVNVTDPTNEQLMQEVMKIGLAYIKADLDMFKAARQHQQSKLKKNMKLLF